MDLYQAEAEAGPCLMRMTHCACAGAPATKSVQVFTLHLFVVLEGILEYMYLNRRRDKYHTSPSALRMGMW